MADNFVATTTCNQCQGSGNLTVTDNGGSESNISCPHCGGDGKVLDYNLTKTNDVPEQYTCYNSCDQCFGTGLIDNASCFRCFGSGSIVLFVATEIE